MGKKSASNAVVAARVALMDEGKGMGELSPRHVAECEESTEAVSESPEVESDRARVVEAYEISDEDRESEPERVLVDDARVCT